MRRREWALVAILSALVLLALALAEWVLILRLLPLNSPTEML